MHLIIRCLTVALILATPGPAAELPADATGTRPGATVGPTEVEIGCLLIDVSQVNAADQSFTADLFVILGWHDPRLAGAFDSTQRVPLDAVWQPRLQILNQRDLDTTFPPQAEVTPEGNVEVRQRYFGTFSAPMDLHDFPLDRQRFSIQLVIPGLAPDEIVLLSAPEVDIDLIRRSGFSVADWSIGPVSGTPNQFEVTPGGRQVSGYLVSFGGHRHLGYWIGKAYISVAIIIAMSWIVFWLNPKYVPARLSVTITSMLTLIAYRFLLGGDLPQLAYLTRMDHFLIAATLLVLLTVIQVAYTTALFDRDRASLANRTNRVSRWAFPAAFIGLTIAVIWAF